MIVFKKVRMKNFLSVGKEEVELSLDTHNITLVTGDNGSAKSAICIDSIYYALYGKSFRKVVLSNIINSTTKKGLLVELEFSTGDNDYKIVRGQKPSVFEIYVNGTLKPQMANVRDYQAYLTDYVLKMDERTFRQLIVIGSSSYTPFMTLSASERRTVIEDLLKIDIFSIMQDIAKKMSSDITINVQEIEHLLYTENMKMEMESKNSSEKIEQMQNSINEETSRVKQYETDRSSKVQLCTSLEKEINSDEINEISKHLDKLSNDISVISQYEAKRTEQGRNIEKHIKFFSENSVCPTCQQGLDKEFVNNKLEELNKKIKKYQSDMVLFEKTLTSMRNEREETSNKLSQLKSKLDNIRTYKTQIKSYDDFIASCNHRIESMKKSILEMQSKDMSDIGTIRNAIQKYEHDLDEIKTKQRVILFIIKMLKDDGVKTVIIKYYLPVINRLIKKYLHIMNFDVEFELDENFNEIVRTKSKESYEYNNFSEGEKMRLDCAIMFAFRELSKIQSSVSTNLLILDEFDRGTLDENGFQSNVDIIRSCVHENIIVISHSPDYFSTIADRIIYVKKEHGFSKIVMS